MFLTGYWGSICDDGFSSVEATVACRQLGFSGLGWSLHNAIIDIINNMCILIQYLIMYVCCHSL